MLENNTENRKKVKLILPDEVKVLSAERIGSQNLYKELNSISFRVSFEKLNTFYKKYPTKNDTNTIQGEPKFE